jgi:hypothetical protein
MVHGLRMRRPIRGCLKQEISEVLIRWKSDHSCVGDVDRIT